MRAVLLQLLIGAWLVIWDQPSSGELGEGIPLPQTPLPCHRPPDRSLSVHSLTRATLSATWGGDLLYMGGYPPYPPTHVPRLSIGLRSGSKIWSENSDFQIWFEDQIENPGGLIGTFFDFYEKSPSMCIKIKIFSKLKIFILIHRVWSI